MTSLRKRPLRQPSEAFKVPYNQFPKANTQSLAPILHIAFLTINFMVSARH